MIAEAEVTMSAGAAAPVPDKLRIASFPPPLPQNPYQRLLYGSLEAEGVVLVPSAPLRLRWLVDNRSNIDVLHFHWPEIYYRHRGASTPVDVALSWGRLALFAFRLLAARALGYTVAWTVHQLRPHESSSPRLDGLGTRIMSRSSHVLVANDRSTATLATSELGRCTAVGVVPHGSYVGVYPAGRPRDAVRNELGLPAEALVFLSLGHLRRYKGLDLLLEAFSATAPTLPGARLVIAGMPLDDAGSESLSAAAAADPRITPLLGFVPDDRVAELFAATDAAVLARSDGGTSGALILALSHGAPVLAAALPAYAELLSETGAGWLFEPGSASSLTAAFERVAAETREQREQRAAAARTRADTLRWEESASAFAQILRRARR